eukprot:COSAG04_NODE_2087_length_4828_cov_15.357418_3_plen_362_part_00
MSRFFHDDEIGDSQSTADGVRWLRENAPEIVPGVNTFSDSGPETLYRDGQFIYSPEQYAVNPSGDLQCNASGYCNGTTMTNQQLVMFANDQLLAERYRLDGWPLFSVFDGNSDVQYEGLKSDSLIRVQVYSAVAFGARGLNYFCYGAGIWNETDAAANLDSPLSNYHVAKRSNADVAIWGKMLLRSRHVGAMRRAEWSPREGRHFVPPAPGRVVERMDPHLLVGVFSDGLSDDTGFLMVVDVSRPNAADTFALPCRKPQHLLPPVAAAADAVRSPWAGTVRRRLRFGRCCAAAQCLPRDQFVLRRRDRARRRRRLVRGAPAPAPRDGRSVSARHAAAQRRRWGVAPAHQRRSWPRLRSARA